MGLFSKKEKEPEIPQTPKKPLSWEELQERTNKIHFNFRFGKRTLQVSNAQVKIMGLCFVMFVLGAYFNTMFHWLFFSSKKDKDKKELVSDSRSQLKFNPIDEEDKSTIEYEQERIDKEQRRLNQKKKRIAIDSLIDNDVFTKKNIDSINKLYPDSICGC